MVCINPCYYSKRTLAALVDAILRDTVAMCQLFDKWNREACFKNALCKCPCTSACMQKQPDLRPAAETVRGGPPPSGPRSEYFLSILQRTSKNTPPVSFNFEICCSFWWRKRTCLADSHGKALCGKWLSAHLFVEMLIIVMQFIDKLFHFILRCLTKNPAWLSNSTQSCNPKFFRPFIHFPLFHSSVMRPEKHS